MESTTTESLIEGSILVDEVTYAVTEEDDLVTEGVVPEGGTCIITTTDSNIPNEGTIIFTAEPNQNNQNIIATSSANNDGIKPLYETILPFTIIPMTAMIPNTAIANQINSTTTTTIRWTYTSGAQVNPNGGIARVRPSSVLAALLAANPMIELDRWCKYTNRYTATCHTCARTFTGVTPKALATHARTAKHRTVFEPLPLATSSATAVALTTSPTTGATSAAEIARLKKLAALVARYPDFGLVDERDLAQNEIFEYELPPEERHLRVNDLYCKVCRRKLVAAQTRYYHRAILDHQRTNKHRKEVEKAAALAASAAARRAPLLLPPKKISTRVESGTKTSRDNFSVFNSNSNDTTTGQRATKRRRGKAREGTESE